MAWAALDGKVATRLPIGLGWLAGWQGWAGLGVKFIAIFIVVKDVSKAL